MCSEFDDLGAVEELCKLGEGLVVVARLVPRHEFRPAYDRLLALAE
jgi:hypothetical protein